MKKNLVFIVEDSLVQQKMLQNHFEEILDNYSVRTFLTPVDLIKNMRAKPFAVVLDHFFQPEGETGLHFLKELKNKYPAIPVIYHTSLVDKSVRDQVLALGAEQYIVKDTSSMVHLRTALDIIHNRIKEKKSFWRTWFNESFETQNYSAKK